MICYNIIMERLLDYFIPISYELRLRLDRRHEILGGFAFIRGTVKSEVVKFHAANMQIKSVRYLSRDNLFRVSQGTACEFSYKDNIINIPITPEIAPGFYERKDVAYDDSTSDYDLETVFIIEFETKMNHNMQGCYISDYQWQGQRRQIIATQFESHYAREAFPCIDEPAAKATFTLSLKITDISPEDVVLANMPLISHQNQDYRFETTPPMSTYLLAWVVGPLKSVSSVNKNGIKVSSYCALNQPLESLIFANQTAERALEYYDQRFGEKYPLPKLDQVALPDFEAGAMENWGLVTYRETMMLADPNAAIDTQKLISTTVTHELSHQWFGNLVTMKWWDDLWLNESFATIMEYYAADHIYPELKVWEDFFTGDCLAAFRRDCLPGVQAVQQEVHHPSEIATLFDSAIVYAKGAHLILMLIRYMGEEVFEQGIRYYFDRFKYANTVGDDLWDCLGIYVDFDVKKFMHAWITQPGYPALQTAHNGNQTWWEQQRFLINGTTDDTQWPLPEIKDDMSGHYLIDLSTDSFQDKLAHFDHLDTEQKLRLLIDRMLLAKSGVVSSVDLLDLLPKFAHETSSAVWEILSSIIGDLKLFCPPDTTVAGNYKQFLSQNLTDSFHKIDFGKLKDSNAVTCRSILLGIAYYIEDETILRKLVDMYDDDLEKLDPELRSHILSAKMYFDESEVIEKWLTQYQKLSDPELKHILLGEIALCARQNATFDRLFGLLNQPEIVRPQDHIYLYIYLLRNYHTRARTVEWLTRNWDYVTKLTGDKSVEDYPRYAANVIRTSEEATIFFDFFDQKKDLPVLQRTIKIAHAEIDARLGLIKREQPKIDQALQRLVNHK